jgi:hypothetical protein
MLTRKQSHPSEAEKRRLARIRRNERCIAGFRRAIACLELDSAVAGVENEDGELCIREPEDHHLARFRQAVDRINHQNLEVAQYRCAIDAVERAIGSRPINVNTLLAL